MSYLRDHILQLENDLLKAEVRKSPKRISELLANDFIEFCSSGDEYHYKEGDMFQALDDNSTLDWEISDFRIKELSSNCILSLFKLIKHDVVDENKKYSLRSSIWKNYDGKWKMFFHQGTLTSKDEIENNR